MQSFEQKEEVEEIDLPQIDMDVENIDVTTNGNPNGNPTGKRGSILLQNPVANKIWVANINPKIRENVTDERVRNLVQGMAWTAMAIILFFAIIYFGVMKRCEKVKSLLDVGTVVTEPDGYTCTTITVPQVFNGQPYYDTAYFWGFAVTNAWGTFRGANWPEYCSSLLSAVVESVESTTNTTEWEWEFSFKSVDDTTETCVYRAFIATGVNGLPNAPGGPILGCSHPKLYTVPCVDELGEPTDGGDIEAMVSTSRSIYIDDSFCPDIIVWDNSYAYRSPLDEGETSEDLCEIWGQDVGIESKAVQSCEKDICQKWWNIVGSALALAAGMEVAVILLILVYYKFMEARRERHTGKEEEEDRNIMVVETAGEIIGAMKGMMG